MPSDLVKSISLEDEYKKNTGIKPEDIAKLREWVNTQPHLPREHLTDLDLILHYHCCQRSSEVTKQLIDLNCTLRTLFTGFFKDRKVDKRAENGLKNALTTVLPQRSKEGYAAYYGRLIDYDPKNFILLDDLRVAIMVLDLWQYREGTWPGMLLLFDLQGFTLSHLSKFDLQTVQQYMYFLQEGMLLNLKGLHFLNAPPFMDKLLMVLRPFMKKELMDILRIHQVGSNTVEEYYPVSGFPKEFGGNGKSLKEIHEETWEMIKANADFFDQENNKRVVESLRPGKPKTITDIFGGIEGSFKKLDID